MSEWLTWTKIFTFIEVLTEMSSDKDSALLDSQIGESGCLKQLLPSESTLREQIKEQNLVWRQLQTMVMFVNLINFK